LQTRLCPGANDRGEGGKIHKRAKTYFRGSVDRTSPERKDPTGEKNKEGKVYVWTRTSKKTVTPKNACEVAGKAGRGEEKNSRAVLAECLPSGGGPLDNLGSCPGSCD